MGNWKLTRAQEPTALTDVALREMRHGRPAGMSRRQLIRRSIGAATALWLLEVSAGTIGFLWPNLSRGFGGTINLGDIDTVAANPAVPGAASARRRAGVLPGGAHLRPADRSEPRLRERRLDRRQRRHHQRPHAVPALPAPGLQAQLLHDQLLVRVPLPRLAL